MADIPRLFADNDDKLHLEPATESGVPGDAVQVDLRRFHRKAKNNVDIWIHVWLTEDERNAMVRLDLRDALIKIFEDWFFIYNMKGTWALDVFWGPGHGAFTDKAGNIIQLW